MTHEEISARIRKLRDDATIAPLRFCDIFKTPDTPIEAEEMQRLDAYFGRFMQPPTNAAGEAICPCCESVFPGDAIAQTILGGQSGYTSWEWKLTHGECQCRVCGYPARAYHYDIGKDETHEALIAHLRFVLPYHPSGLRLKEEE